MEIERKFLINQLPEDLEKYEQNVLELESLTNEALFSYAFSLGMRLAVAHNLYFYNNLTRRIREALEGGYFESFYQKYRLILGERCPD